MDSASSITFPACTPRIWRVAMASTISMMTPGILHSLTPSSTMSIYVGISEQSITAGIGREEGRMQSHAYAKYNVMIHSISGQRSRSNDSRCELWYMGKSKI